MMRMVTKMAMCGYASHGRMVLMVILQAESVLAIDARAIGGVLTNPSVSLMVFSEPILYYGINNLIILNNKSKALCFMQLMCATKSFLQSF